MAQRQIPAQTVIRCDRCDREGVRYQPGPFAIAGAHLRGEVWSTGIDGTAGGAQHAYDLCSDCLKSFHSWIKTSARDPVLDGRLHYELTRSCMETMEGETRRWGQVLSDGEVHHIAVTKKDGRYTAWIDGRLARGEALQELVDSMALANKDITLKAEPKLTTDPSRFDEVGVDDSAVGRAFRLAMTGRVYGYEALSSAWLWYREGWRDAIGAHRWPEKE